MQSSTVEKRFEIGCKAEEISPLLKQIFSELDDLIEPSAELKFNLELAAREMLANAIEHGCALAAENDSDLRELKIRISLAIDSNTVFFSVQDPGPGFDWENYELGEMPEFDEKGRGLKMINQVSDQMDFNDSGNKIRAGFKI